MRTLHLPQLAVAEDNGSEGTFTIEPLYGGFGVTLGNSLRRVLLSSLEGAAVTAFKVEGVSHEFSSIKGVKEDAVQITLNLKTLRLRLFSAEPQVLRIVKKGKGKITAANIETNADVEVIDPTQVIATLDDPKATFEMEIRVEKGRGYLPLEGRSQETLDVGMIGIDALFSPVQRVRYHVSKTRVGQVSGLDKLVLDIVTDGSISPTDALHQSAAIIMEQLSVIAGDQKPTFGASGDPAEGDEGTDELNFSIEDLGFSPRTTNALLNNQITTVRELIQLSDTDLRNLKGFGSKAFNEVLSKLKELELR